MTENKIELINLYDPDENKCQQDLPLATYNSCGVASFNETDFDVNTGKVKLKYDFAKYLFPIEIIESGEDYETYGLYDAPSDAELTIIPNRVYQFLPTISSKMPNLYLKVNGKVYRLRSASGDPFKESSFRKYDVVTVYCIDNGDVLYTNVEVKGEKGDKGDSIKGDPGNDGVSIVSITNADIDILEDKWIRFNFNINLSNGVKNQVHIDHLLEKIDSIDDGENTITKLRFSYREVSNNTLSYIMDIPAKNGKDTLPLTFVGNTYYDPAKIEEYEEHGIPIDGLIRLPDFADTNISEAYLVDDAEVRGQYDLYIHNKDAETWVIIDDWGGVPGQPGRGISSIVSTKHTSENGETVTYADIHYTDGTVEQDALEIHAQNGENGAEGARGPQGYTPLYCRYIVPVTNPTVGAEVSVLSDQLGGDLLTSSTMNCLLVNTSEGIVYTAILKWKRAEGDNEIFTIQEFYDISGNPGANALYFKSFTMSSSSKPGNSVWTIPDNWELYFNRKPLLNDVYLQLVKVSGTNDVYLVPQFVEMYNGKLAGRGYSNKTYKLNGDAGLNGYSCWYYEDTVGQHDAGDVVMLSWTFIKPFVWDHNLTEGEAVITKDGYLLTLVNNVDSNVMDDFEAEVVAKLGGGGSFIEITSPTTATNGTLTDEQFNFLQESIDNYIVFAKEIYKLQDNQHDPGYLIYTHVGHNSTDDFVAKCITITVSTKSWVLTSEGVGSGYDLTINNSVEFNTFFLACSNNSLVSTYGKSIRTVLIKNTFTYTVLSTWKIPKEVILINCLNEVTLSCIGNFTSGCVCAWDFEENEEYPSDLVIKNLTLQISGPGKGFYTITGGLENCKVIHTDATNGAINAYEDCDNLTNCIANSTVSVNMFLGLEVGFLNCSYLTNCVATNVGTGYKGCTKLVNCNYNTVTSSSSTLVAFYSCTDMVNSYAKVSQSASNAGSRGLFNCNKVANCEVYCGGVFASAASTGYIYYTCSYLNNCMFSGPSMPAHVTYAWSGNNRKRDDNSCLISLSDV